MLQHFMVVRLVTQPGRTDWFDYWLFAVNLKHFLHDTARLYLKQTKGNKTAKGNGGIRHAVGAYV